MRIFNTIIDKYKAAKQKSLNKKEFRELLLRSVGDGKLMIQAAEDLQKEIQKQKAAAAAQKAVGDYQISMVTITKEGEDRIKVSGRISGGKTCKTLRVFISLSSDKGGFTNIITSVEDVGGSGSQIFEGSDWVGSSYAKGNWKIVDKSFRCIQN